MPAHHSFHNQPYTPRSHRPPASPRPTHQHADMDWAAVASASVSSDPIPPFSTLQFPTDLFTRTYLEPGIRYYNTPESPAHQRQQQQQRPEPPYHYRLPPPSAAARPQTIQTSANHKVYEVSCHCGTLLSDRGMKAVLLLKPHITLYSTDCMPTSTGSLSDADDVPESGARPAERTCACLTSNIGCLCCGALVGYHILSPCEQCTGSQRRSRSANGHRFVFHQNAVLARERVYALGQSDVLATSPKSSASSSRTASPNPTARLPSPADLVLRDYIAATGQGRKSVPGIEYDEGPAFPRSRAPSPRVPSPAPRSTTDLEPGQNVYWRHLLTSGDLKQTPASLGRRGTADQNMLCRLSTPFGGGNEGRPLPIR